MYTSSMNKYIIISLAIIAVSIILSAIIFINGSKTQQTQQHHDYCLKWKEQLDIQVAQLNKESPSDSLLVQYNAEVADYNKQCYY